MFCFPTEKMTIEPAAQRQADNQGLRVNVLTMIVYPALVLIPSQLPAPFSLSVRQIVGMQKKAPRSRKGQAKQ